MSEPNVLECEDLDVAIEEYKAIGYRLDMIFPADNPREALMSRDGESVRLAMQKAAREQGRNTNVDHYALADAQASATEEWIIGRAGMEYRDLIPDRLGDKVIASHIRLTKGGEVPDYAHYHKIDFQMIYCKRGRIKVVYEDQGEPFWLETGDCVLQPPEIRHRVLECTAGAEVFEVSMPAEHETWAEHEISLPTSELKRDRDFSGQRFFHFGPETGPGPENAFEVICVGFAQAMKRAVSADEVPDIVIGVARSLCQM
ncbi:MAG: cupin domain-containing protein [Pyrinomonadaceae bacterium]